MANITITGSGGFYQFMPLEKKGERVFPCDACLEYYNTADKLRAGVVSNIYAIVDALLAASKAVRI